MLEAEELRSRRHGGMHGLVLVRLDAHPAHSTEPEQAALAIARAPRELDLVARIDHRTFGVLALHCDDLERVLARLRASLDSAGVPTSGLLGVPTAGANLRATWSAVLIGSAPATPTARHLPFVAPSRVSLN